MRVTVKDGRSRWWSSTGAALIPALVLLPLVVLVATGAASGGRGAAARGDCRLALPPGYAGRVEHVLKSGRDVWGDALLGARGGPTDARARRYLAPLFLARGPNGRPLTESGAHYLAFTQPVGDEGSGSAALHVADGSQILSKRLRGRSLTIGVGKGGRERFGSCLARARLPRLADGYLPILQTEYVDALGVRYRQESFAARAHRDASLTSYVRIDADARFALGNAEIRVRVARVSPLSIGLAGRTMSSSFLSWSHAATSAGPKTMDRASYESARAGVVRYWSERLSKGTGIDVPEARVRNAAASLLIQNLGLGWRYSIGNPYQQFSYPEALDVARVMAEYGFSDESRAILRRSLSTPRGPYPSWRLGQRLVAAAAHYRLTGDDQLVAELTPDLRRGVGLLARRIAGARRILRRERFSSDIPDLVYGLHSQAVAWQGLRDMSRVWSQTGERSLAVRCGMLGARLGSGLRAAVRRSRRMLPDGSVFVPVRLLDAERPYASVTETRPGSYWNLVMPYALASGLFEPRTAETDRILEYMLRHGSRFLGLVRAGAYSLYGRSAAYPTSGVNPVYGQNVSRLLAADDRPDQLVLSLYGQLAVGMSAGTFVAGEAASVSPLRGDYFRSMYLPPNAASNASFLETLRLMLVHETRDRHGAPRGLELAYATPRAWLASGRRVAIRNVPTSFGSLSYEITSAPRAIRASIDVPARRRPGTLRLRIRLPGGRSVSSVLVSGRRARFDRATETVDLSGLTGRIDVTLSVVPD
jgi:hypothetical protein